MFSLGSRRNLVSRIFRAAVAALPSGNGVIAATVMCVAMPVTVSADGIVTLFAGRSFEGQLSERVATYGVSLANGFAL